MECALCKRNVANKKNTHFLSDSIIRTCLNENGENIREKGFYFDVSNNSAFVEFNFQRRTTIEKLTSTLGREPNDEEIKKARQIPFSVDNVFCSNCERIFTDIEEKFTSKYLDKFRSNEFSDQVAFADFKVLKSFFLLQVWRTGICDEMFFVPEEIMEKLRLIILNNKKIAEGDLIEFPLSITYLTTDNSAQGKTGNFVGYTDDRNPNLIIMNDFIIQFFDNKDAIRYFDFYDLNSIDNYEMFLNLDFGHFVFKILTNEQRVRLLKEFIEADKIESLMKFYAENFARLWFGLFGNFPSTFLVNEYLMHLTHGGDKNLLQYTRENIFHRTRQFIEARLK
jgi:hypothetical protein